MIPTERYLKNKKKNNPTRSLFIAALITNDPKKGGPPADGLIHPVELSSLGGML